MSTVKTARVILTKRCERKCDNCCNTFPHIMKQAIPIRSAADLDGQGFKDVCITGGEPLLDFEGTYHFARDCKELFDPTIYLYATIYHQRMQELMDHIDGVHFTVHKGWQSSEDVGHFLRMQWLANHYCFSGHFIQYNKSFRLLIVEGAIMSNHPEEQIQGNAWKEIKKKRFKEEAECKIPEMETLFIVER